jgi:two-component system response regulator AtoC
VLLYDDIEIRPEYIRFLTDTDNETPFPGAETGTSVLEPGKIRLPADKLDLKSVEEEIVKKALVKFKGNKTKAAEYLGLTRSSLRSRLKEL